MKTIMLVDDKDISNFIMRKYINIYLPGTEVLEFTDPQEALRQIEGTNPDILFLDLAMPFYDGWDFLTEMKERDFNHPVAVLTTSINKDDRDRALLFPNVVHFFVKPIDPTEVKNLFERQ